MGDQIRDGLTLKLFQKQVARQLGFEASIYNGEASQPAPTVEYMPNVIRFHNPLPPPQEWAGRLVHWRTALGLSQKESGCRFGVDRTLARWERCERQPTGTHAARALRLLNAENGNEKHI